LLLEQWIAQRSALAHSIQLVGAARSEEPTADSSLTFALVDEIRRNASNDGALFMAAATARLGGPLARERLDRLLVRFRKSGILALDLDRAPGFSPEAMVFQNDGHWNARGHAFVAKRIGQFIDTYSLLGSGIIQ
jgi:hypothetical protein